MRHLVVGVDHRRGKLRVHHRARRRGHRHRTPAAGVGRDQAFWIGDHLQRAEHAGRGDRERRIHRARHLRIGAGEVGDDRVAALDDAQLHGERLVVDLARRDDAVAVEDIGELRLAIGQRAQRGAHHGFRVVLHLLHDVEQRVGAVFRRQRLQPRRGTPVRRHLRAQIAEPLGGGADIGEDDRLDGGIRLAVAIQADRRQAQALAVDLGHRAVAAGRGAADVGPVRAHAAEAEQAAFVECGRDDVHVGQMRAALIRIVVDEHVAGRDIGKRLHDRAHRIGHRAEMDRQVGALRDHVAADVEDAAGVVAGHLQQRRIRGLRQDDLHLLGRAGERVLHHLEAGRVGLQAMHLVTCHCEERSDAAIPIDTQRWRLLRRTLLAMTNVLQAHRSVPASPAARRSSNPSPR